MCEFEDKGKDLNRSAADIEVFKWTETPKGEPWFKKKKKKAKHSHRLKQGYTRVHTCTLKHMHLPQRCSTPNTLTRVSALYITGLFVSHCEDSDPEPAIGDQTPLGVHTEVARMAGLSSVWMGVMGMLSLFCLSDVNCTKESVPRVKLGYKGRHLHLLGDNSETRHNELIILR